MSPNGDWWLLISIGFLLLVPLLPAVILYKLFEQKTIVTGPFKGLRLDLSGAFAGYFLLLVLCSSLFFGPGGKLRDYRNQIAQLNAQLQDEKKHGIWTVRGRILLKESQNIPMEGIGVAILPPPQVYSDGLFEVSVVKDKSNGQLPTLEISKAGYFKETVHLETISKSWQKYSKSIDESGKLITIDDPIELTKE